MPPRRLSRLRASIWIPAYEASRYGKGTADYINCPFSREEYEAFWNALTTAEEAPVHGFEDSKVFEGCMPIEVNARRGFDTLRFGILKPIGLPDPKTGKDPYAVLQLRRDNANGTLYNLVGCQTHLKFGEQKRVFSMIPALRNAEFVRYGVMHRNTFGFSAPAGRDLRAQIRPAHPFCGPDDRRRRLCGVHRLRLGGRCCSGDGRTRQADARARPSDRYRRTGDLHFRHTVAKFQPMNVNFGIIEPLGYKIKGKREKNTKISERALEQIEKLKGEL